MRDSKYKRFKRIYPWFSAFATDLIFYVIIGDLFFSVEKGFTSSQIVSLTTISLIVSLVLEYPLYLIIKKIGNTASIRAGSIILCLSSILITFGGYIVAVMGKICYEIAFSFLTMTNVILKNNVNSAGVSEEYVELNSKSNSIYSFVTIIVALCASFIFNINHYLAMLCSTLFTVIAIILSFLIKDTTVTKNPEVKTRKYRRKFKFNNFLIIAIVIYMLFYPTITTSQSNSNLLIQYQLLDNFSVERTAIFLGVIVFVARILKLLTNITFNKIYQKLKDKVSIIFAIQLFLGLILVIVGAVINTSIYIKAILMAIGFCQFLAIRDPVKVYFWNFALNNAGTNNKQAIIVLLNVGRKFFRALFSLMCSLILIYHELISTIYVMFGLSVISLVLCITLLVMVKKREKNKELIQEKTD